MISPPCPKKLSPQKEHCPSLSGIIRALERTLSYSETSRWGHERSHYLSFFRWMSNVGIVTDLSPWSDRTTRRKYVSCFFRVSLWLKGYLGFFLPRLHARSQTSPRLAPSGFPSLLVFSDPVGATRAQPLSNSNAIVKSELHTLRAC